MGTITKKKNSYMKLSIQVNLNGLSFCALNQTSNSIVFYKSVVFEKQLDPARVLEQIELEYEQEKSLNVPVEEVKVLFNNNLFSLVPQEYFKEEQASSYLKFNTKILKTDIIAYDSLQASGIVNIYIPYTNITNFFFEKYGEFEYQHSLSVLIESLTSISKPKTVEVYLHTHQPFYELVIFQHGKLLLANSFEYSTKEDFLYYLLFTIEQLGLDALELDLILLGDITKDSEEYELTWQYIKNIHFLGPFHSIDDERKKLPEENRKEFVLLKSLQ